MKRIALFITVTLLLGIFFSFPCFAQTIEGGFLTELTITPLLPQTPSLKFLLYLGASYRGVTFRSETVFDLTSLGTQTFTLDFTIGILSIKEEIIFSGPTFSFHRNDLLGSVSLAGLDLRINFLLANLTTLAGVYPGLAVEIGGKTPVGVEIYSYTGFGVQTIAEDLGDLGGWDLCNTETWSFNCRRPLYQIDADPDRQVISTFVFTEEVLRISLTLEQFKFLSDTKFTSTGFKQEVLTAGYSLEEPNVLFSTTSVFDFDNVLNFAEEIIRLRVGIIEPLHFFSVTYLNGPPLTFNEQELKLQIKMKGYHFQASSVFNSFGLSRFAICLGFEFSSG